MTRHRRFITSSHWQQIGILGLLVLAGLGLILMGGSPILAQEGDPRGAAYRGQRIFSQRCTQCHGTQGRGDGPMAAEAPVAMADFTDAAFVETRGPQDIFDVTFEGRIDNLMPPWRNALSEAEIWDVTAYIWSLHLSPVEIESGAMTFEAACADCHGLDGTGNNQQPGTPDLAAPTWLQFDESEWLAGITSPSHPSQNEMLERDLMLAAAFARKFSLGFNLNSAEVDGDGSILVRVQNGTSGEQPAGVAVELLIFDANGFVSSRDGETNEEGMAIFTGLSTEPIWAFVAQTMHGDMPFASDMVQFEPSSTSLEAPLSIYETGATVEDINISRAHWVVSLQNPHSLDIGELYAFTNSSDRVFVGDPASADGISNVLRFYLPENATNVSFEGGEMDGRFVRDGNVVVDTLPLPPGQRQILFGYSLPVVDGVAELSHAIAYPVDDLNLMAPDIGIDVEAPDWVQGNQLQAEDSAFLNFTLANLPGGSQPSAVFSGIDDDLFADVETEFTGNRQIIDANATPGISGQPYMPIVVIAASVAMLAAATIFLLRRQQQQLAALPIRREQQKQALIQQIADLDDEYETGDLSEADYQAERRLLKSQLVALTRENTQ